VPRAPRACSYWRSRLPGGAAEWGLITRARDDRGGARAVTGNRRHRIGTTTLQWVYEGAQAPVGTYRMTWFGLLTADGYKKDVVRDFRLDTKPARSTRSSSSTAGAPPVLDFEIFLYRTGLLVLLR